MSGFVKNDLHNKVSLEIFKISIAISIIKLKPNGINVEDFVTKLKSCLNFNIYPNDSVTSQDSGVCLSQDFKLNDWKIRCISQWKQSVNKLVNYNSNRRNLSECQDILLSYGEMYSWSNSELLCSDILKDIPSVYSSTQTELFHEFSIKLLNRFISKYQNYDQEFQYLIQSIFINDEMLEICNYPIYITLFELICRITDHSWISCDRFSWIFQVIEIFFLKNQLTTRQSEEIVNKIDRFSSQCGYSLFIFEMYRLRNIILVNHSSK